MSAAVYLDYDQAGLDAQYNNRERFPFYIDYFNKWPEWSQRTRERMGGHLNVAYGDDPAETLDIFPAAEAGAPVHVFIHGGYWYALHKDDFSFVAEGLVPNGVTSVIVNYGLAPTYRMDEIVRQNRAAIAWLWRHIARLGADPDRIYVCGQSAGGHLLGMLLATDWPAFSEGLPRDPIKGGCSTSGLFDLQPIRLSYLNQHIHLDEAEAERNTPLRAHFEAATPLMIVVGEDESAEFHRHNREMAARWRTLGYPLEFVERKGEHHFAVCDAMIDPHSDLVQAQLDAWAR